MAYKDPHDERARAARRRHYQNNKDAYKARAKANQARLRQYVLELKNVTPCVDCGAVYPGEPWLTEYDHIGTDKRHSISSMLSKGSLTKLKEEIDKCELRCLICHRRKTAERGGWLDNRLAHLLQ